MGLTDVTDVTDSPTDISMLDMIKKFDPKNHSGFLNLGISRGGFWTKIDDFIDFSHSNLLCISADFYTFKIKISTKIEINMQDICYIKHIPLKFFFFQKVMNFFLVVLIAPPRWFSK